jgi:hypothetical protein
VSRRLAAIAVLGASVAVLAGCAEQTSPDVMLVTRTGTIPGARLSLRITDDGRVSCNRGALREVTSAQLILARVQAKELADAAKRKLHLRPGAGSVLSYTVKLEQGTVRFSDDSRRQSKAMFQLAYLTRQIAQGACGLVR